MKRAVYLFQSGAPSQLETFDHNPGLNKLAKTEMPESVRMGHRLTGMIAGGGVKPGLTYGATDDFGYNITENPVHVNDLHATILHLLGIDHRRLTIPYQGLDLKLSGVEERHPVKDIMA